jgi:hypothetical protein
MNAIQNKKKQQVINFIAKLLAVREQLIFIMILASLGSNSSLKDKFCCGIFFVSRVSGLGSRGLGLGIQLSTFGFLFIIFSIFSSR